MFDHDEDEMAPHNQTPVTQDTINKNDNVSKYIL